MKRSSSHAGNGLTRREIIGSAAAIGVASLAPRVAAADVPPRGEFIVRNAYVLTMDAALGDLPRGDIHVRNGNIIALGPDLSASDVPAMDGRAMIALPGLIDTHNH